MFSQRLYLITGNHRFWRSHGLFDIGDFFALGIVDGSSSWWEMPVRPQLSKQRNRHLPQPSKLAIVNEPIHIAARLVIFGQYPQPSTAISTEWMLGGLPGPRAGVHWLSRQALATSWWYSDVNKSMHRKHVVNSVGTFRCKLLALWITVADISALQTILLNDSWPVMATDSLESRGNSDI